MEHNRHPPATPEQDTIFTEPEFTPGQYDKSIRQAKIALFVISAVQMGKAILYIATDDRMESTITFFAIGAVATTFLALGIYTKKKPFTCIVSGLILYVSLLILDAIVDPDYIFKFLLFKGSIIFFLVRSINDAKEAQDGIKQLKG